MRNYHVLLVFFVVASEGCHLQSNCRKKRSIQYLEANQQVEVTASTVQKSGSVDERWGSIHGGCPGRLMDPKSDMLGILTKYGLHNPDINAALSGCVAKKLLPFSSPGQKTLDPPLNINWLNHYYFMYNWFRHGEECTTHKKQCDMLVNCLTDLIRKNNLRSYWWFG